MHAFTQLPSTDLSSSTTTLLKTQESSFICTTNELCGWSDIAGVVGPQTAGWLLCMALPLSVVVARSTDDDAQQVNAACTLISRTSVKISTRAKPDFVLMLTF